MKKDMNIKQNQNKLSKQQKLKQAVIWAEILGKPKALKGKEPNRLV